MRDENNGEYTVHFQQLLYRRRFFGVADCTGAQDADQLFADQGVCLGADGGRRRDAQLPLGFTSPEFALSLVFAAVVMYDAMGVRRAAGEQAKVLNKIVAMTSDNIREMFTPQKKSDIRNLFIRRKNMEKDPEEERKREEGKALLKELLGHTPLEVLAGALLGIAVAMLMPVF